jgi:hypothetical protein
MPDNSVVSFDISAVANKLIDKTGLGSFKEIQTKTYKSIMSEIASRQDIDPIERMAIVHDLKRIVKEFRNKHDIVEMACKDLHPDAKPEELNDDWMSYYFDKARLVTDEKMRIIWAKLLANEVNEPNSCSKNTIHILSIMNAYDAQEFMKLIPFYFTTNNIVDRQVFLIYNLEDIQFYQALDINLNCIINNDKLGLISYLSSSGISFECKEVVFYYGKRIFNVSSKNGFIDLGCVALTPEGKQLLNICEPVFNDRVLDNCIKAWNNYKYEVTEAEDV